MAKSRSRSSRELRRQHPNLEERERVLIVTEGSKTEPEYFRRLIQELGLTTAQVKVVGDGDPAPISVVQHAKALLKVDDDFEHVFLVFDRDSHTTYNEAISKAKNLKPRRAPKKQVVVVIPSIPCFEIWYLFHVSDSRSPYPIGQGVGSPAQDLIQDLKDAHPCFAAYDKATCAAFYDEIKPMRDQACTRAVKALEEAWKEGKREFQENPSTRVHVVVERLQDLAHKQKRGHQNLRGQATGHLIS